jgi:ABC-type multidrug transport system ATPase subunit
LPEAIHRMTELSARQNVLLNGVMLGLTPRELRTRLDSILEYAEVEEFADLELKNFSSGMRVRLAFAVMVQADPEIFLIDEVLAVGDASFREKCIEVLEAKRDAGKTIVLVSHQMSVIERQCDTAILLGGGRIVSEGDPAEVAQRYLELDLESPGLADRILDRPSAICIGVLASSGRTVWVARVAAVRPHASWLDCGSQTSTSGLLSPAPVFGVRGRPA